jgi:hypothetical protein
MSSAPRDLVQSFELTRADQGDDVLSFRQHPRNRQLCDSYTFGVCLFAQLFDKLQVVVQVFALEPRVDAAEVAIALT